MTSTNFHAIPKPSWSLPPEIKTILDFGFENGLVAHQCRVHLDQAQIWGFTQVDDVTEAFHNKLFRGDPTEFQSSKSFDLIILHEDYLDYFLDRRKFLDPKYWLLEFPDTWLVLPHSFVEWIIKANAIQQSFKENSEVFEALSDL